MSDSIDSLGAHDPQLWFNLPGPDNDVVLSSRVRLARNLMGYAFPPKLSSEQEIEVRDELIRAFQKIPGAFHTLYLDKISPIERKILLERNIVSQEFAISPNKAVILSEDERLSAMINEEDHLRLACIYSGLCLDEVYQSVDSVDTLLEDEVHYAASLEWGYLNTSLHNTGTGMRASVMLHLQALVMDENISWALKIAGQLGLQIKGYWGDDEDSLGNIYQISNQVNIGLSEKEIINSVQKVIVKIIEYERRARMELLKMRKTELEDRVFRALGLLRYCRMISSKEAIELLSTLRLGLSLKIIEGPGIETVTALLILSQKSHVQKMLDSFNDETDNKLVDYTRAKQIRRALEGKDV